VDNGKEAVSNSVEELIDTVKTRIQTIRDTPGVTKVNYGTARIFTDYLRSTIYKLGLFTRCFDS
jgi:hypothetical protein